MYLRAQRSNKESFCRWARAWEVRGTKTILLLFNDAYANRTRGWRFVTFYAQTLKSAGWNAFCVCSVDPNRLSHAHMHILCAFACRMLHAAAAVHNTLSYNLKVMWTLGMRFEPAILLPFTNCLTRFYNSVNVAFWQNVNRRISLSCEFWWQILLTQCNLFLSLSGLKISFIIFSDWRFSSGF